MKIFTGQQIHELDGATIEKEGIKSIDLMERAAIALTDAITRRWDEETPVVVFAGPGNNGGDALAVSRLLLEKKYNVKTYLFNVNNRLSADCEENKKRLVKLYDKLSSSKDKKPGKGFTEVVHEFDPPKLTSETLVIDGLFGSGLNKPLAGGFAAVVKYVNQSDAEVVSIDVPSGLMTEDNTYNVRTNIIKADLTLTLGQKKLAMLMADNQQYLGELQILDIGLSREFIEQAQVQFSTLEREQILSILKPRNEFAHKGTMGHAILIAGSRGMAGAAILASRACLRSGVGKVTVHTPSHNTDIMQISVPEAIVLPDRDDEVFTQAIDSSKYSAMGIGPGLGTSEPTAIALMTQIRSSKIPTVIDADAINILGSHKAWLQQLPEGMIFTPHPKEMDRLSDTPAVDDYDRLVKACEMAQRLHGYVILKGHYSALCLPNGQVIFNSTGNAGMATAGSGDVLTGIITGLLARGYNQQEACMLGMYVHGLAGDLAARDLGMESLIASDIIRYLPKAFCR